MNQADIVGLRRLLLPGEDALDPELAAAEQKGGPKAAFELLAGSKPFRKRFAGLFAGVGFGYPPVPVETVADSPDAARLFDHVRASWEKLGTDDPHWSVLSSEAYRKANMGGGDKQFFRSGEMEIANVVKVLRRCGVEPKFDRAAEFGCGLGRISMALAEHCRVLDAYDISRPHLDLARKTAEDRGRSNIRFHVVTELDDPVEPGYDFFYSVLVFQHNPPPVIRYLLTRILDGLAPGGTAMFQLPIWRKGYSFNIKKYLDSERSLGVEMHCLPQRIVFDLIADSGCRLLDLSEVSINLRDRLVANLFTVQKAA